MDPHDPRKWHWVKGVPESLANTEVTMAIKTLKIRRNADNTLTIKANQYTENISIEGKSEKEILEGVRYALICAHFSWNSEIRDFVRQELGSKS